MGIRWRGSAEDGSVVVGLQGIEVVLVLYEVDTGGAPSGTEGAFEAEGCGAVAHGAVAVGDCFIGVDESRTFPLNDSVGDSGRVDVGS